MAQRRSERLKGRSKTEKEITDISAENETAKKMIDLSNDNKGAEEVSSVSNKQKVAPKARKMDFIFVDDDGNAYKHRDLTYLERMRVEMWDDDLAFVNLDIGRSEPMDEHPKSPTVSSRPSLPSSNASSSSSVPSRTQLPTPSVSSRASSPDSERSSSPGPKSPSVSSRASSPDSERSSSPGPKSPSVSSRASSPSSERSSSPSPKSPSVSSRAPSITSERSLPQPPKSPSVSSKAPSVTSERSLSQPPKSPSVSSKAPSVTSDRSLSQPPKSPSVSSRASSSSHVCLATNGRSPFTPPQVHIGSPAYSSSLPFRHYSIDARSGPRRGNSAGHPVRQTSVADSDACDEELDASSPSTGIVTSRVDPGSLEMALPHSSPHSRITATAPPSTDFLKRDRKAKSALAAKKSRARKRLAHAVVAPDAISKDGTLDIELDGGSSDDTASCQWALLQFAQAASAKSSGPVTSLDWIIIVLQSANNSKLGKNDAIDKITAELGKLSSKRVDIFVCSEVDIIGIGNFRLPKLAELFDGGLLPILATLESSDNVALPDAEVIAAYMDETNNGQLLGKIAVQPTVFDAGLPLDDETSNRKTSLREFRRYMVKGYVPRAPLNWLDLRIVGLGAHLLPSEIWNRALDAIVCEDLGLPWEPEMVAVCSTANSCSPKHIDTGGPCVFVMATQGRKVFYLLRGQSEAALRSFATYGDRGQGPSERYTAVCLDAGSEEANFLILPPGQVHWVWTFEASAIILCSFYTAATFAATIRALRFELLEGCWSNDDISDERWNLLNAILKMFVQRRVWRGRPVFADVQSADIEHELEAFMHTYDLVKDVRDLSRVNADFLETIGGYVNCE